MKILHIIPTFGGLTGAELYVYDLARKQAQDGHDVGIYATKLIEGKPVQEMRGKNVEILDDLDDRFDIIHAHQAKSAIIGSILDIPVVQTIHSELFPMLEYPVVNKNVVHYICIRPTIQDEAVKLVDKSMTSVIFNGVDENRFRPAKFTKDELPTVLFVGPNDYLRERAIKALLERVDKQEILLILIGRNQNRNGKGVVSFPEMVGIDLITQKVDMTASVMLGRTTIEGWLCGKPGIVFTVNNEGEVLDQDVLPVPKDTTPYTLTYMHERIMEVYARHLHPNIR